MIDLSAKKLIIFDADGTLRRCTVPGQPCPNKDDEWELMPGVKEKIAAFPEEVRFAIVSNQGGVGLKILSEDSAWTMLLRLEHQTTPGRGIVFMCPHAPKAGCFCRKPHPYLLYKSMKTARASPSETLYVGDMDSDREAAQRAGVDFLWAWEFFGWEPVEGQAPGGLLTPKNVSVAIKWDLGQGNEEAIFVRPKLDLLTALQAPHGSKSAAAFLSQRKLTIPAGTFLAEYEVEGSMSSVDVAEQLNAEHGENFTVTAIFPTRIKVCTARSFTVNLDIANS